MVIVAARAMAKAIPPYICLHTTQQMSEWCHNAETRPYLWIDKEKGMVHNEKGFHRPFQSM
jgi:hypothetical protein